MNNRLTGVVKWFDSRKGFGFTTCLSEDHELTGKDVFLHFTSITVENRYKKVFPGEYISFEVGQNNDGQNVTKDVRGVMNGPLLVENEDYIYRAIRRERHYGEDDGSGVALEEDADAEDADADAEDADAEDADAEDADAEDADAEDGSGKD